LDSGETVNRVMLIARLGVWDVFWDVTLYLQYKDSAFVLENTNNSLNIPSHERR